jgi:protoheme IX farnesyltransferase
MSTVPAAAPTEGAAPTPGAAVVWSRLAKARLSALVLVTAAVGFLVAPAPAVDWARLGWACLGTGLAATSAAMLNQLAEVRRDARMRRTAGRPLPAGHARPRTVFVVAVLAGYAGCAALAFGTTVLACALAAANILLYVLLYTPLKPRTTFNTLVGAVTGAIPPVIGWTAVTGSMAPGAWALFALLFAWQIPHFLALAWLYRADYAAGGFAMLPVRDPSGTATAQAALLSSLALVPVGLLAVLTGIAGVRWYAPVALVAGLWMSWLALGFLRERSDARARRLFLASLAYLPIVLGAMVADRTRAVTVATPGDGAVMLEVPAGAAEETP